MTHSFNNKNVRGSLWLIVLTIVLEYIEIFEIIVHLHVYLNNYELYLLTFPVRVY